MIRQDLDKSNLPITPGVYFFKDAAGKILYIGKATVLRDRVRSYFSPDVIKTRGAHIVDMVFKASKVDFEEAGSVLEALMLEANYIKKWQPYYNTKEKDDKSYNCVVVTKELFPRVLLVRQKDSDAKAKEVYVPKSGTRLKYDTLYGPYPNGSAIKEALRIIRRIFPYLDTASLQKDKVAFYRQVGLSPDTRDREAQARYKETVHHLKLFFSGKMKVLRESLTKDMQAAAKAERFEEAQQYKEQLFALDHIRDVSLIKRDLFAAGADTTFRIEGYDVAHLSGKNMVGVMVVADNDRMVKSEYRKFTIKSVSGANDPAALTEMLERRLNHHEWQLPNLIVVDGNTIQRNAAQAVLLRRRLQIPVVSVVKDERHKPKEISGEKSLIEMHKLGILLANSEAHRFALSFHKEKRKKQML
ncbi:MAG TPA: GIY-YIG nuclease family protein [Candidatus Paceibacterota bacterium]|nr:GIY-YIG nuclease family protein [Candidatus Paceibacterota bacterium]